MKPKSFLSRLALLIASLFIVVSCTTTAPQSNTKSIAIRLGYSAWPGWFPWEISKTEKVFEVKKADVDLRWFDNYLKSIHALNEGKLDANSQTLNDTINSIAAGADQVIVLVNDNSTGNDQIIVRQGIDRIADLKGKKVAAEEGTVDHFLLLLGMKEAGLSPQDIQFVPLDTEAAAKEFAAGKLDAVGVFAPFTTQALKRQGSKVLFSSKNFPGAISDHLVFNRKFVNDRPQDVQAIVDSWFATQDYIRANSDKAISLMSKRAEVSVDEYKGYDDGTKIFSVEENLKAFQPGNDMSALSFAAQKISTFLVDAEISKKIPDLTRLFDDRFVKSYASRKK
jgi:NitT/TauT family transport system substrate-binding protein